MPDIERDGAELWRRYRAAGSSTVAPATLAATEPEPGLVAAYLEHRLDETEAAPVEAWLARDPDALAVLCAPAPTDGPAPLDLIRRARAMVATPARVTAPAQPGWRQSAAWASIAASLVIVGVTGFLAGHDAMGQSDAILATVASDVIFGAGDGEADGTAF